jgi:protein-S-isoprenylcysteine O-methyltransferase Ste14
MKATAFEFRHRLWFILAIYVLGFVAPWNAVVRVDGHGPNAHVWGLLAVLLAQHGLNFGAAFNVVLAAAIAIGLAGAWVRTWGSAYLGAGVMRDENLRGDGVVADGPYRYLRNPLYVGSWLFTVLLALLMPPSGAIFCVVALAVFQIRLILGEEAFLAAKLGAPYTAYCAQVPRIVPSLRARVASSGARPRWGEALLAEIMMWGVLASFAVVGWKYNVLLLDQCVLVWLGVSMVVRAFGKDSLR